MLRPWQLAVAARYVRSRNRNRFISFISLMSIAGIGLGVAVLVVVLSVMNGFEHEIRARILQVVAHGTITGLDGRLEDWRKLEALAGEVDGIRAVAPFIGGQGMLVGAREVRGVELRGVNPEAELATSGIGGLMRTGNLQMLEPGAFRIILGSALAEALEVGPGDRVVLLLSEGSVTPAGIAPRMRRFEVAGILHAGMYEYDRGLAILHIADAARLWRLGNDVSGVRIATTEVLRAPLLVRELARAWGGGVYVSDWTRQHANFFRSIQITKSLIFMILLLVVAVAAFNIVSTLVMVVRDKRAEVAILRTLGASPGAIMTIFMLQGSMVGVGGTLLGAGLGVLAAVNIDTIVALIETVMGFRFLAPDVYFISDFPSRVLWTDVFRVTGIAFALAVLSTLYPAWRAARLAPAGILRHD